MIPLDPLQTPAAVLGMAGAVLVAGRSAGVRVLGFGAWVIGNLFWVAYGVVTGNPYVMVMFAFYWVTAVVGVVNMGKDLFAGLRPEFRQPPEGDGLVEVSRPDDID